VLTWTAARWAAASRGRRRWATGAWWLLRSLLSWLLADVARPQLRRDTRPTVLCAQLPFLSPAALSAPACSDSPYATDPWNLSVLPRQAGMHSSLLRVLDGNIAGG